MWWEVLKSKFLEVKKEFWGREFWEDVFFVGIVRVGVIADLIKRHIRYHRDGVHGK
jgi:REP element-mobilizing transposase RayT